MATEVIILPDGPPDGRTRAEWVDWCKFMAGSKPELALAVLSDVAGRRLALEALAMWRGGPLYRPRWEVA